MTSQTTYTDDNSNIATGFTNPTNAEAEDSTYATAAPAQNGVISSLYLFPDAAIPAGASIQSVSAIIKWKVSTAASIATLEISNYNDEDTTPTIVGGGTDASEPLTDLTSVFPFSVVPSLDDLNTAGRLGVVCEARRGNSATAVTFSVDYIALLIEYNPEGSTTHSRLEVSLRDTDNAVWSDNEIDSLLGWALDETNRVRPRVVSDVLALIDDDSTYVLTNVWEVFRVDLLDENDKVIMHLPAGSWEIWGDNQSEGQTLYINPMYAREPQQLRVHGYGPYDFVTNTPPTQVEEAILAIARAEALRRVATERARFEQYATGNPRSDVSVNELIGQVNDADQEAQRLLSNIKLIRRPTVGKMV